MTDGESDKMVQSLRDRLSLVERRLGIQPTSLGEVSSSSGGEPTRKETAEKAPSKPLKLPSIDAENPCNCERDIPSSKATCLALKGRRMAHCRHFSRCRNPPSEGRLFCEGHMSWSNDKSLAVKLQLSQNSKGEAVKTHAFALFMDIYKNACFGPCKLDCSNILCEKGYIYFIKPGHTDTLETNSKSRFDDDRRSFKNYAVKTYYEDELSSAVKHKFGIDICVSNTKNKILTHADAPSYQNSDQRVRDSYINILPKYELEIIRRKRVSKLAEQHVDRVHTKELVEPAVVTITIKGYTNKAIIDTNISSLIIPRSFINDYKLNHDTARDCAIKFDIEIAGVTLSCDEAFIHTDPTLKYMVLSLDFLRVQSIAVFFGLNLLLVPDMVYNSVKPALLEYKSEGQSKLKKNIENLTSDVNMNKLVDSCRYIYQALAEEQINNYNNRGSDVVLDEYQELFIISSDDDFSFNPSYSVTCNKRGFEEAFEPSSLSVSQSNLVCGLKIAIDFDINNLKSISQLSSGCYIVEGVMPVVGKNKYCVKLRYDSQAISIYSDDSLDKIIDSITLNSLEKADQFKIFLKDKKFSATVR